MILEEHLLDRVRLFHLISCLEADLRDLLRNWVVPNLDETVMYGELYETLVVRRGADGETDATASLLEYLDFSDAYQLLNRYAAMLPSDVSATIKRFTPRLEPLVQPRNRVMHTRVLQPGDEELVLRLATDFIETTLELPRLRSAVRRFRDDPSWTPEMALQHHDTVAHNLPLPEFDETGLLGRQQENEDLLQRLLKGRDPILTVVGEGGIGKTALVVKTLDDLIQRSDCPYLAVLWTSLKTERLTGSGILDIEDAARDVLDSLDLWLPTLSDGGGTGSVDELVEILQDVPALIVIDNLETASAREVISFYDRLPDDTRLLCTSRIGLGQLERRIELEPLDSRNAALLLRKYAQRRGVRRLAQIREDALVSQAERLRRNPLALRWYVEAVEAGQDPEALLRNQQDFLRFSFEAIYDGLSEHSRQVLAVMHVAGRRLDVPELAFLMESEPDEIRRSLLDLGRRSLLVTRLVGAEQTHEVFGLSSSTALYLASEDRPTDAIAGAVAQKERQLRETHEQLALAAARNPLSPNVVDDLDGEARPVAHLLASALRLARGPKANGASAHLIEQARQLAPQMYEVYRVEGLVLSRPQPEASSEAYEQALRLAPSGSARARVAYFYAEHCATVLRDGPRALELAREAHDHFGLPITAGRLGRVLTYQCEWNEAERYLRIAVTDDDVRSALIARTQLVDLTRRRIESTASDDRLPDQAVRIGATMLAETLTYLATGRVDEQLIDQTVRLASDMLGAARDSTDIAALEEPIGGALRLLLERRREVAISGRRGYIIRNVEGIVSQQNVPEAMDALAHEVLREIQALLSGPVSVGRVKMFDRAKGFGFLTGDGTEELYFRWTAVPDANDQIFLVPGSVVEFVRGDTSGPRAVAESVTPVRDGDAGAALRQRLVRIVECKPSFAIGNDDTTGVKVLIHQNAFVQRSSFRALEPGDLVRASLELVTNGPRALNSSAEIVRSSPSASRSYTPESDRRS